MSPSAPRGRIVLYVSLTALTAVSIDALLPRLRDIAGELGAAPPLFAQHVVTLFIFGMVFGELLLEPISDAIGRKQALVAGLGVYAIGTLVALFASFLEGGILGRVLQGIGLDASLIAWGSSLAATIFAIGLGAFHDGTRGSDGAVAAIR